MRPWPGLDALLVNAARYVGMTLDAFDGWGVAFGVCATLLAISAVRAPADFARWLRESWEDLRDGF